MSTQRERRRQQYETTKPRVSMSSETKKKLLLGAVILVGLGIIVGGMAFNQAQAGKCPGHWHSTVHIYVDGERVPYNHPEYDLDGGSARGRMPISYHFHQPNDAQIHWEPVRGGCESFSTFLRQVDTRLTSDTLVLDGSHEDLGQAGTWTANATHTLRAFVTPTGQDADWEEISIGDLNKRQPPDGERALILFGQYTDDEITLLQRQVPFPSGTQGINMG